MLDDQKSCFINTKLENAKPLIKSVDKYLKIIGILSREEFLSKIKVGFHYDVSEIYLLNCEKIKIILDSLVNKIN